jgi:hypothetical protein
LAGISNTIAQEEESEEPSVFPVHITVCSYKDGKGQADLDAWFEKFNAWAGFTPSPDGYSAWTLTPYYYGPEQDFDFLWLGTSPTAAALGLGHDTWVHSAEIWPEFKKIANCVAKSNFATLNIKEPADVDSTTSVLSFSDCELAEGKSFDDVEPALQAWSEYRAGHGSEAGMWVMWPAYGGGGADYDFKFAVSHPHFASWGVDYDQYVKDGYAKAEELFGGLLDCDESRVYNARQQRDGISDDG